MYLTVNLSDVIHFAAELVQRTNYKYMITCNGGQGFLATGDACGLVVVPLATC